MLFKVIFWLSCSVAISTESDAYGGLLSRIIGGNEATFRYKFMASIQTYGEIKDAQGNGTGTFRHFHRCGGSIIRDDCIVTAAHCVLNVTYNKLSVLVGTNNLDDLSGERYFLRDFIMHSNYSAKSENDIAVLRLNKAMPFSDRTGPIAQSKEFIHGNVSLRLIGWGITKQNKSIPLPRKLQETDTTSLTNEKCNENELYKPTDTDICTQQTPIGACSGDSGGPLFLFRDNMEEVLVGMVSRGFVICAYRNMPDIYCRASLYVDWINEQCDKP